MQFNMTSTMSQKFIVAGLAGAAFALVPFISFAEGSGNRAENRANVDRTCMAEAVETREAAIAAAWEDFNESITAALKERKDALIAAWSDGEDGSRNAIKDAWKAWKADSRAAHTELRADRRAAWDAFNKTAKSSCKMTVPREERLERGQKDSIAL
jgi:hypothetical protein